MIGEEKIKPFRVVLINNVPSGKHVRGALEEVCCGGFVVVFVRVFFVSVFLLWFFCF